MPDPDDPSLRDTLLRWVSAQGLAAGSRLPAAQDLARLLGTSRFAVNQVLLALVAEGLVQQPSRKIRLWAGNPERAGQDAVVIVGDVLDGVPPGAGQAELLGPQELHLGVLAELRRRARPFITITYADFIARGLTGVSAHGVLIMPGSGMPKHRALLDAIARLRVPAVIADEEIPIAELTRLRADVVISDQASGAEALVRYLHARGRRHIRMLLHRLPGLPAPPLFSWITARLAGQRRAFDALGLPCLPPIEMFSMPAQHHSDREHEDQVRLEMGCLVEALRGSNRPDALMLLSDGQTFATGAACRRLGLVPGQDIDVTGYDNYAHHASFSRDRALEPGVPQATFDRCLAQVGAAMVQTLCERVDGRLPPVPIQRLVPGRLVVP